MNKTLEEIKKELVNKRFWTLDQWKNGNDIERLVWFISTLSPHNLWRGQEAVESTISQTKQETIKQYSSVRNKLIDMYRKRKGITVPNELVELALKLVEKKTKQELIEEIEEDLIEVLKKYGRTSEPKEKSLNNWKQGHDEAIFNVIGFFGYLTRKGIFRKTI